MAEPTPQAWAAAVLRRLGIHQTPGGVQALAGWAKAEGGHWNNDARYNPLNTTQSEPGAGNTGTQGNIKVYKSWDQGIDATVKTLRNGRYGSILSALAAGDPRAVASAIDKSPWGTHGALVYNAITGTPRTAGVQPLTSGGKTYTPPSSRTTTKTVGAVDNSQGRKDLAAQFLLGGANAAGQRNTTDVLGLALAAQGLKDQQGHQVTTTSSSPATSGAPSGGGSFAKAHSPLLELIHNTGSGPGYAVKNGQVVDKSVYSGVWAGHANHVHVAAGPKTIVELGKLAQRMGLHVGENPHFGGVNPVHVPGSYHYKGEAIDVSGDPGAMNQFAAHVERLYKLKR